MISSGKSRLARNVDRLVVTVHNEIEERLQRVFAKSFRVIIYSDIVSQKYASSEKYADYSKGYRAKKMREGKDLGFWRYNNDLLRGIKVFRNKGGRNGWFTGIPRGMTSSEGRDITKYGLLMEWGSKAMGVKSRNQPARPLWKPATKDFAKDKAYKLAHKSLRRIKASWERG